MGGIAVERRFGSSFFGAVWVVPVAWVVVGVRWG